MSPLAEKIARFLAQGFKPAQVASIVGCTPALISQLAKDEAFQKHYASLQEELATSLDLEEEERLNNKYLAAEHLLLDSITSNAAVMDPRDQIKALDVVAARQEKRQERLAKLRMPAQPQLVQNIVQLAMPQHALPEYRLNEHAEVISIANRPMAPMSSDGVKNLFAQMQGNAILQAPNVFQEI